MLSFNQIADIITPYAYCARFLKSSVNRPRPFQNSLAAVYMEIRNNVFYDVPGPQADILAASIYREVK